MVVQILYIIANTSVYNTNIFNSILSVHILFIVETREEFVVKFV